MEFDTVATVIGLVAAFPVGAWVRRGVRMVRLSRFLGFDRSGRIDAIVTTSADEASPNGTSRSYKTNYGEVQAIASLASAVGREFKSDDVAIHLSEQVAGRLGSNIVVLGGPLMNSYAATFIERVNRVSPELQLSIDTSSMTLRAGDFEEVAFDLRRTDNVPARDLGVVVIGSSIFEEDSRAILCAGFSTYGTAAAAHYLFGDLLKFKNAGLTRGAKKADVMLYVVEADISARSVAAVRLRHRQVLQRSDEVLTS